MARSDGCAQILPAVLRGSVKSVLRALKEHLPRKREQAMTTLENLIEQATDDKVRSVLEVRLAQLRAAQPVTKRKPTRRPPLVPRRVA